jgi:hypothetical protein
VKLSGRCLCGEVTWAYDGEVARNLVCHCEDCQRATSAPFAAFLGLCPDAVIWNGKIIDYESSPQTYRGFCPTCGTRLYFRSEKWPEEIHVMAATLGDFDAYVPTAQVVLRSRRRWLNNLQEIPGYEGFEAQPKRLG